MTDKPSIKEYLEYIGTQPPSMGGGWRKMKCPFHPDSRASAAVNYDKELFKCHGCDVKGDTYAIIMKQEGLKFIEAIKFAQTVLASGNNIIRQAHRSGRRVPVSTLSNSRRSRHLSSRSSA